MRRLDELMEIYHKLADASPHVECIGYDFTIGVFIKRLYVLCAMIYPEYMKSAGKVYRVDEGILVDGSYDIQEGEMVMQYSACYSDVLDYLLCYIKESPYWDFQVDELAFSEYCDDDECEDRDLSPVEFLRRRCSYYEEGLLKSAEEGWSESPLKKVYDLYEYTDGCAADSCVVLISKLFPFYKKHRKKAKRVDKYLCELLDTVETELTRWLPGYCFSIVEGDLEQSYYIGCDNSSYYYDGGYGGGVLESELQILVCGEIIDRCILSLDEKMGFLPEELRQLSPFKKEVAA